MATIGWSLSGLFVRLMPGLDGWQINCWRGFWLALALVIYLVLVHGRAAIDQFDAIPFSGLVISALCFAAGTTFYVTSLTFVSTATVSVIGATSPLITALLSPWITGERPHLVAWISAILAIVGSAVITQDGLHQGNGIGILLSFGVPLTFAIQTLLLRKYRDHDMMAAMCVGGVFSFIIAGIASGFFGPASAFAVTQREFVLLAMMGVIQLALPIIFYAYGARTVPGVTLALIAVLDAVFNPFWSWAFVGEMPDQASVMGGAVILVAVLITVLGGHLYRRLSPA
ncbi:MAG: EamA family transporter [Alphaproteobacteria bacterium]|nr:EamA family transporter [Alphaproteobacteria bacterium]